ncbi:hypothetical protein [Lentimicrobium sp. S6]|uniref:hypothetical protein n=1 Tax=Lentimicrobium sp. S6 TaxID=2735872 RepID=UPI0015555BA8|nr:hypothetical protein [Lentimicrobium sp. S6]NPD48015.1 hypothetical protein [Lentimicrobium sp. S6]
MDINNFKAGQEITTKAKNLPFVAHKGILVPFMGSFYVLHNTINKNVHSEEYSEFVKNREVLKVEDTDLCVLSAEEILDHFDILKSKKYNLISYNSEHFVEEMKHAPVESETVNQTAKGLAVFVAMFLVVTFIRAI